MLNITQMQSWNVNGAGPAPQNDAQGRACVANIDAAGRRQRLIAGIVEFAVGFGILAVLLAVHANPLWRLPLLLVFWGAAVGFFQWRDRT
jgi:hypothetical protein